MDRELRSTERDALRRRLDSVLFGIAARCGGLTDTPRTRYSFGQVHPKRAAGKLRSARRLRPLPADNGF